ncbi:TrmH family RNA methyltransferase [Pararhizobium haloflavum]|uniref:TrmH family RNA methyltransferase n=1 Tax=Pararhizobium haloflavum TaxID=2037914 RepID=UPI000C1A6AA3|nr:RNA methyltransferase [Pararhizobium haloflavum]
MTASKPPRSPASHTPRDTHYANLRRTHRDQKATASKPSPGGPPQPPERVHLYGLHTVRAAMSNPARTIERMLVTKNALMRLDVDDPASLPFPVEVVHPSVIDRALGGDATHQGVMIEAKPLPVRRLSDLKNRPLIVVLDQVTDPHNVGAIMRSAVAFEAGAVITTMRHSPQESGVLAKSASGALEHMPYIQITNLADALKELADLGFVTIGLDSEADAPLEDVFQGDRIALVFGAEGKGLRQKTRDTATALARLDMPGPIKSLNVSNATAIALYAARRHLGS